MDSITELPEVGSVSKDGQRLWVSLPQASRPSSERPQSHRFLHKTLNRLSDDATRVCRIEATARRENSARRCDSKQACHRSLEESATTIGTDSPELIRAQRRSLDTPSEWEYLAVSRPRTNSPNKMRHSQAIEPCIDSQPAPVVRRDDDHHVVLPNGASMGRSWVVLGSEIEHYRRLFRDEASECLAKMRSSLDESNITRLSSHLEEWRKTDVESLDRIKDQTQDIATCSCELRQVVRDFADSDEMGRIKGVTACLQKYMEELSANREAYGESVQNVAEKAAKKILQEWDEDALQITNRVIGYAKQHKEFCIDQQHKWFDMGGRVDKMQVTLDSINENIKNRYAQQTDFEQKQRQTLLRVESMVDESQRHQRCVENCLTEMSASLLAGQGHHAKDLKDHMDALLMGSNRDAEETDGTEAAPENSDDGSVFACLKSINSRLAMLESSHSSDIMEWQSMARTWQDIGDKATKEATTWRLQAETDGEQLREVAATCKTQQQALQQSRESLMAIEASLGAAALRRIKDIESRGNIRVNRQTGDVDIRQVEFKPVNTSAEPVAEFKDFGAAEKAARDVFELASFFNVPMSVEAHLKLVGRGGTQAFWESLVKSRAETFKAQLDKQGLATEMTTTNGLVGKQGSNNDCIIVRLERSLFPSADGSAGGRSPTRSPRLKR
eukprot:TRINITY_DN34476_c0_g2_i1.p1 TRINITY_DN34476_c0_g2~~TRINITY_DN34476_c0_g2_i1.p1  ORF type:complete len:672 (-),score=95.30 TRINITY_DN34476_c0_g2_i1:127-2142(-)